jgi:hypothetical protein
MATKKVVIKKPAKKAVEKDQPVELKKLVIKIHGKELMLTPQEAKELKGILDELFEESKEVETTRIVHEHIYPYTYPYYPQIIYVKPYEWTKVWYGDVNTTTGSTGNYSNNISWTTTCNNAGTLTCNCG